MEEEIAKFWENIQKMVKGQEPAFFFATVTAVNVEERTCTVKVDRVSYEEVRLYGVVKKERKGFCFIPAVGSMVLVGRIDGSNELFAAMFTEVDQVLLTIGKEVKFSVDETAFDLQIETSRIKATSAGLSLTRGDAGLKKTLEELINAVCRLTVTTATGPSGTPINAAEFMRVKNELSNYLEG